LQPFSTDGAPGEIAGHIRVPRPFGRLLPAFGAALRASKCALHTDVQVPRSAWMRRSGVPGSGLPAIWSNSWGCVPEAYLTPPETSNKKPRIAGLLLDGAPRRMDMGTG